MWSTPFDESLLFGGEHIPGARQRIATRARYFVLDMPSRNRRKKNAQQAAIPWLDSLEIANYFLDDTLLRFCGAKTAEHPVLAWILDFAESRNLRPDLGRELLAAQIREFWLALVNTPNRVVLEDEKDSAALRVPTHWLNGPCGLVLIVRFASALISMAAAKFELETDLPPVSQEILDRIHVAKVGLGLLFELQYFSGYATTSAFNVPIFVDPNNQNPGFWHADDAELLKVRKFIGLPRGCPCHLVAALHFTLRM